MGALQAWWLLWHLVGYCGAWWNIVEPGGIQDVEVGLFSYATSDDIFSAFEKVLN